MEVARKFYYVYLIAKNNFGADVGFLKIEVYRPNPENA